MKHCALPTPVRGIKARLASTTLIVKGSCPNNQAIDLIKNNSVVGIESIFQQELYLARLQQEDDFALVHLALLSHPITLLPGAAFLLSEALEVGAKQTSLCSDTCLWKRSEIVGPFHLPLVW